MQCLYFCDVSGSHWLSCSNKKAIFPAVGEVTRWEILLILHEKKKKMRLKKCFSFSKSKLCIPLAHHARFQAFPEKRHLFGAALCRFIFSECTKAETLSVLLPTCWLPYKGTESQARRTGRPHRAEASLFSRRPLSSSAPGEVDPHDTEFHQIHLAPAF